MSEAYSDIGPATQPSTSTGRRSGPNPRILQIVTEIGLRYRPLATADQEAHAATVMLLAKDLADVDPAALRMAANEWARTERFMPKAIDLLDLIQKLRVKPNKQMLADQANAHAMSIGRHDIHWVVRNDQVVIEWKHPPQGNLGA